MNQDSYSSMVRDGRDLIQILQNAPESQRMLTAIMAEAFLSGLNVGEKLATGARPEMRTS